MRSSYELLKARIVELGGSVSCVPRYNGVPEELKKLSAKVYAELLERHHTRVSIPPQDMRLLEEIDRLPDSKERVLRG